MPRFSPRSWTAPIALFLICALAYGVTLAKQGFYWDDWTIVWYIHFLGPSSFPAAFASDRPLLAWIYQLTTPLLGESPLNWQVFAVFTRWLACAALWWALSRVWQRRPLQIAAVALLFAVYPGFKQQHIAITYGNAFVVLAVYLASWALMLEALRRPGRFWLLYLASLPLAFYAVFTAEHFFGLELLRPVLLWLVLSESLTARASRLKRTLLLWLPYLIIDLAFLAWRISNPTPRAEITLFQDLQANPLAALWRLAQTAVSDAAVSSLVAWAQVFDLRWLGSQGSRTGLMFAVSAAAAAGVAALALGRLNRSAGADTGSRRRWARLAIGLGIFSLLAGGIPIWPTNLRIALFFPWDRFTLPMMLGAALLLVGLIELVSLLPYQNLVLTAVLVGLAAGFHYQNALSFQADWQLQRDFFWQLTWRAPGIEPGTVLLTSELPFAYDWDNSLTAPLNWTYAPDLQGTELPYLMYNAESRLSSGLPALKEDTRISESLRITPFNGSVSQAVVFFFRPTGACLKVIDPQRDLVLPDKPRFFREIAPFSNPDWILSGNEPAAQPPGQFFDPQPDPDWCYYFEKAELARQTADWAEIVRLGERAFEQKQRFGRRNVSELLPFIEGYARSGDWDRAVELTLQAYQTWENLNLALCQLWSGIAADHPEDPKTATMFEKIRAQINCREP